MVILRSRLVTLAGLAALVGCAAPEPAPPPVDLAADAQAIRDASMAWLAAVQAKDHAAAAANYAPDGMAFPEHQEPLVGPAAYQAHAEAEWAKTPNATVSWTVDDVVVASAGDMAMEKGSYTFTNEGQTEQGRYITVWRKVDGAWKVAADIGVNTTPEPAETK